MSCLWLPLKHSSFSVGTDRDRSQPVPAAIQPPSEEVYPKEFPPWRFFQTHLLPVGISVIWAPPCPHQSFQQLRRYGWITFRPRPWREEVLSACPCHRPSAHSPLPRTYFVLLSPLGARFVSSPDCGLWVLSSFPSRSSLSSSPLGAYTFGPFPSLVYGRISPKEGAKAMSFGNRPVFKSQVPYFPPRCLKWTVLVIYHISLYFLFEPPPTHCASAPKARTGTLPRPQLLSFSFLIALLRHNSHTIGFIHLKYAVQWFSVCLQRCVTITMI